MNEIIKLAEERLSSQLYTLSNMQQGREEVIEALVMSQKEIESKQGEIESLKKELRELYRKFPEYQKHEATEDKPAYSPKASAKSPAPFYGGKARSKPADEDFD